MDVIDYELKRYEAMLNDLETRRSSCENITANGSTKVKDQSKSADDLDTLMNEEKPREVNVWQYWFNRQ